MRATCPLASFDAGHQCAGKLDPRDSTVMLFAEPLADHGSDEKAAGDDLTDREQRSRAMFEAEVDENDGSDDVLCDRRAALTRGAARLHAQDFTLRYFSLIVIVLSRTSHVRCCSRMIASKASSHGISRT